MIYPAVTDIIKRSEFENIYTLVICASQRARQLREGAQQLTDVESNKYVTIAVNEIYEQKITYIKLDA